MLGSNRRHIEHIAFNQLDAIVFRQHAGGHHHLVAVRGDSGSRRSVFGAHRISSRSVSEPAGSCRLVLNDTSTIIDSPVLRNACTTPGGMVSRHVSPAGTSRSRIEPPSLRRIRHGPTTLVVSTAVRCTWLPRTSLG